ncbi:hypothetical protein DFH06DRAFT_1229604 [Mycena polygramma]|nr:hypothetical protein DFH06DRAFT_1229604 [Mycena polygramma]
MLLQLSKQCLGFKSLGPRVGSHKSLWTGWSSRTQRSPAMHGRVSKWSLEAGSEPARLSNSPDFFDMRAPDSIYIDKTSHLEQFLKTKHAVHIIKKPRRSGKTALLSMARSFFSMDPATKKARAALFDGLAIKEELPHLWNNHFAKYPVVHITFKDIHASTIYDFRSSLTDCIDDAETRLTNLGYFHSFFHGESKKEDSARHHYGMHNTDYLGRLLRLCRRLEQSTGVKPIVLIDEYDAPIAYATDQKGKELVAEITQSMNIMMSMLFKAEPTAISRALLVGVNEMPQSDHLNNVSVYGANHQEYSTACHFTRAEVDDLYFHYEKGFGPARFSLQQLNDRYRSSCTPSPTGHPLFSPFAIMDALNHGELKPLCTPSGNHPLLHEIRQRLKKATICTRSDYIDLICGESIHFDYKSPARYGRPETSDEYWSLMLDAGFIAPDDVQGFFKASNPSVIEAFKLVDWDQQKRSPHHLPLRRSA